MMTLAVYNRQGQEVGSYELDPAEIAPSINRQLLHDVVVMYEANRRVGTVRTKSRGEVVGSGKKLYRQKGTGNARMGSRRTNLRRGGGMAFAKRPKDWGYRLPRKAVRSATRMALLSKLLDDQATIIDELSFTLPKTKEMHGVLNALGLGQTSCLVAVADHDVNVWKSARNMPAVRVSPARELNAYDLLRQRRLLITRAALDLLREPARGATPAEPSN
jgi:large subunit ribosomal protein L4